MNIATLLLDVLRIQFCIFLVYLIGKFFYKNLSDGYNNPFVSTFIYIFFGTSILVCFFSLIITKGVTINLIVLALLCIHYRTLKIRPSLKNITSISFIEIAILGVASVVFCLLVFYQLLQYDFFNNNSMRLGWGDFAFYSDQSENLLQSGNEGLNSWFIYFHDLNVYTKSPSIYHYFDLWLNSILLKICTTKGVYLYIYLFIPLVGSFVFLGFYAINNIYFPKKAFQHYFFFAVISFLFLFFIGIIPVKNIVMMPTIFSTPKVFVFYLIIFLIIIFYFINLTSSIKYFLCLIGVFNPVYLPIILLTGLGYYLWNIFISKKNIHIKYICVYVFTILFFLIFYLFLFKDNSHFSESRQALKLEMIIKGIKLFFRGYLFRYPFYYVPLFLFLISQFVVKRSKILNNELFIIFLLFYFVSLILTCFFPHIEAFSFNYLVANPLFSILSFWALTYTYKEHRNNIILNKIIASMLFVQMFGSFLLVSFSKNTYLSYVGESSIGKVFLNKIKSETYKNNVGGYLEDTSNFKKDIWNIRPCFSWYSGILDIKDNGFYQTSLSTYVDDNSVPFKELLPIVHRAPLYNFYRQRFRSFEGKTKQVLLKEFIEHYNLGYVIVPPNAPHYSFLDSICRVKLVDSVSGISVFIIK